MELILGGREGGQREGIRGVEKEVGEEQKEGRTKGR